MIVVDAHVSYLRLSRILVPSDVIGAIIGRKGQTIRNITEQTKARYGPSVSLAVLLL